MTFSRQNLASARNRKSVLFLIVCIVLLPIIDSLATGPVRSSIDNAEHWVNLTNSMFYSGQDYFFSYGPLFWLIGGVSEYFNSLTYYTSILFSLLFFSAMLWSLILIMHRGRGYFFLILVFISFFSFSAAKGVIFLWPLLFLFFKELYQQDKKCLSLKVSIFLGAIVGFFFFIRFFYGLVALVTIGGYFVAFFLRSLRFKEGAVFTISSIISFFICGVICFRDVHSVFTYFAINSQLSFGNAVDMTLDIANYHSVYICAVIVLGCFVGYAVARRIVFLVPLVLIWALLFKLGFGRADHYISYFVTPCIFISLLISFDKGMLPKFLFGICFASLYYLGTHPAYSNSPTLNLVPLNFSMPQLRNPFHLPFDKDKSYSERMAEKYSSYKLPEDVVQRISTQTVEVYPYNNEYVFANRLNYKHRPSFQNYMTLTPQLDQMNATFLSSADKPEWIIWTGGIMCADVDCNVFVGLDNKYILNEDPLTNTAIFKNYAFVQLSKGKNDEPVALLRKKMNPELTYTKLSSMDMKFGQWFSVPESNGGIVKVSPDFKLTLAARLKNLLFRGDILKVKYKLASGAIKEYRLNIINSQSGVWISPLLDGFNSTGFSGDTVTDIMFEANTRYYFNPEFTAHFFKLANSSLIFKPREVKYNEQQEIVSQVQVVTGDCEGSIDFINDVPVADMSHKPLRSLSVKGWLANSVTGGILYDQTYIALTDSSQRTVYFDSRNLNRGDLVGLFGHASLQKAGYQAILATAGMKGDYTVSLAGLKGMNLLLCRNIRVHVTIE